MRVCESCQASVSADLQFCPSCGRRLSTSVKERLVEMTGHLNQPLPPESGYLEFLGGPEDGRVIRLNGERVTVGRREENDIVIQSDTALSRRHAFIYRQDNQFWIEDRKSSFGTWVEGERVPVETAAPLNNGHLIRLAYTTMLFHLGELEEIELQTMARQVEQ